tara:strand:- start:180 stop:641 length:462 start_codon:yes stop_codon:yes gene_type:complete
MAIQRIKIEGIEELTKQIMNLSDDKMKRRELLKILRRQAKPLLASIKSKAPVADKPITVKGITYKPENLKKSFVTKTGKSKQYPHVVVKPDSGKTAKYDGWYIHFLAYGTNHIQGDDFIKKGADEKLPTISVTASEELRRYVVKKTKQIPFIK